MMPVEHTAVADSLRDLLAEVLELDADQVTVEAAFHEQLEMDSLQKIEVITQVERSFDVRFDPEEAAQMNALTDILSVLRERGLITTIPGGVE